MVIMNSVSKHMQRSVTYLYSFTFSLLLCSGC